MAKKKTKKLKIDELSLLRLLRYEAEMRASSSEMRLNQIALTSLLKQVDPEGVVSTTLTALTHAQREYEKASAEYSRVRGEVERKLGIVLSEYVYDDVTGVLEKVSAASGENEDGAA